MIQQMANNREDEARPTKYSIETPPRHKVTLIEGAARLGAAIDYNNDNDDHDNNIARSPVTTYQIQFKARGLDLKDLSDDA